MRPPLRSRRLVAAAVAVLLAGGLSACTGADSAAQQALQAYVDGIATGDAAALDELAERTVTDDPEGVAAAAAMLVGATERIDVLEVGAVHEAEAGSIVDLPPDAGLDSGDALAATVQYRLAGEAHERVVVLAPTADGDRSDPTAWAVVVPLMGTLELTPALTDAPTPLDRFIAGVEVPFPDPGSVYRAPLYPGTYELSRRLDPYLTSPVASVTITAGDEVAEPAIALQGTDAVVPVVTEGLVAMLDGCPSPRCPDETMSVLPNEIDDIWSGDWQLEVLTSPELQLDGMNARFTGGELRVTRPDGSAVELIVEGTVAWRTDAQSGEPFVAHLAEIVEMPG